MELILKKQAINVRFYMRFLITGNLKLYDGYFKIYMRFQ